MKSALILVFSLILSLSYAIQRRASSQTGSNEETKRVNPSASPASIEQAANISTEQETRNGVPSEWKGVDFKNFSYPTSLRWRVRLKDGAFEKSEGIGGNRVEFQDVYYVDLTRDGKREAVVQLHWVACGGSCDGGSHLFYFYSIKKSRPTLISRIETGSLAYGCGLKSLNINKQSIELEVFWKCHRKGSSLDAGYGAEEVGKFSAKSFTRFLFEFKGRKLVLKERDVFPFPPRDAKNYSATIRITND
jgi:hypothetical protein